MVKNELVALSSSWSSVDAVATFVFGYASARYCISESANVFAFSAFASQRTRIVSQSYSFRAAPIAFIVVSACAAGVLLTTNDVNDPIQITRISECCKDDFID